MSYSHGFALLDRLSINADKQPVEDMQYRQGLLAKAGQLLTVNNDTLSDIYYVQPGKQPARLHLLSGAGSLLIDYLKDDNSRSAEFSTFQLATQPGASLVKGVSSQGRSVDIPGDSFFAVLAASGSALTVALPQQASGLETVSGDAISANRPDGTEAVMSYGMLAMTS